MRFYPYCDRIIPFLIAVILTATLSIKVYAQEKTPSQSLSKIEQEKLGSFIKDYILNNPEHIIEAIQIFRQREELKKHEKIKGNLINFQGELFNDPDTPVGGNQNGSITIVEFFDYSCGYCKRALPDLIKLISSNKNIRFVFKEFPILGAQSIIASKAGLAAWILDKGKYQIFHKAMMKAKGRLSKSRVLKFAANSGYDVDDLQKTMKTPRIDAILKKTYILAKALDINGTPAFVIGDKVIRGAIDLETLKSLVSQEQGS